MLGPRLERKESPGPRSTDSSSSTGDQGISLDANSVKPDCVLTGEKEKDATMFCKLVFVGLQIYKQNIFLSKY